MLISDAAMNTRTHTHTHPHTYTADGDTTDELVAVYCSKQGGSGTWPLPRGTAVCSKEVRAKAFYFCSRRARKQVVQLPWGNCQQGQCRASREGWVKARSADIVSSSCACGALDIGKLTKDSCPFTKRNAFGVFT